MSTTTELVLLPNSLDGCCACALADCPWVDVPNAACPEFINRNKQAMLEPRRSMSSAASGSSGSPLLHRWAVLARTDPRYRRSGATGMFIRHILHPRTTRPLGPTRPHWEFSLLGLVNIYAAIHENHPELPVEDAGILDEIFDSAFLILEVILAGLNFLRASGAVADLRRLVVSKFLFFLLSEGANVKRSMYDERILNLVLHCWLDTSPEFQHRKVIARLVWELLAPPNGDLENPSDRLLIASRAVEMTYLTSRVNFLFKSKGLLGENLTEDISTLMCLVVRRMEPQPFAQHLLAANIPKQVALAVRRQLLEGPPDRTAYVLAQAESFFENVIESSPARSMSVFSDLLLDTCIVDVAVAALKIANKTWPASKDPRTAGNFFSFFRKIGHCMTCERDVSICPYRMTPQFQQAARTALERVCVQTFFLLHAEAQTDISTYTYMWSKLILGLGITDSTIRERYRLDRKCCNIACLNRNSGSLSTGKSLQICIQCKSIFYCDRECQKIDWRRHRKECKDAHNAPETPSEYIPAVMQQPLS